MTTNSASCSPFPLWMVLLVAASAPSLVGDPLVKEGPSSRLKAILDRVSRWREASGLSLSPGSSLGIRPSRGCGRGSTVPESRCVLRAMETCATVCHQKHVSGVLMAERGTREVTFLILFIVAHDMGHLPRVQGTRRCQRVQLILWTSFGLQASSGLRSGRVQQSLLSRSLKSFPVSTRGDGPFLFMIQTEEKSSAACLWSMSSRPMLLHTEPQGPVVTQQVMNARVQLGMTVKVVKPTILKKAVPDPCFPGIDQPCHHACRDSEDSVHRRLNTVGVLLTLHVSPAVRARPAARETVVCARGFGMSAWR